MKSWGAQLSYSKPEGLAERVAVCIAEQIIHGVLIEGERIQELRLAKQLAVSRGSIREAMPILKRTGLVQVYPCRGALVSELSESNVGSAFRMLSLLSDEVMYYCCQGYNLSLADELYALKNNLARYQKQKMPQKFLDEIFIYFCGLVEDIDHPYLLSMYLDILPAIRRSYFYSLNCSNCKLEQEFSLICAVIDAITSKNSHQAALFMQDFCRHLYHLVQQSLIHMKQIELDWACR